MPSGVKIVNVNVISAVCNNSRFALVGYHTSLLPRAIKINMGPVCSNEENTSFCILVMVEICKALYFGLHVTVWIYCARCSIDKNLV